MEKRRAQQTLIANPVLVGAVTTLVTLVAVFLAYNANSGLPFVPTKQVKAVLRDGSNLVEGNDVRAGGYRIGLVESMRPLTLADGRTVAEVTLKLDKKIGDIPADSRVTVRPRSALGLKYVVLEKGRSRRMLRDGDTIPMRQTTVPVQFDEIFKLFDARTRPAVRENLSGFGTAFAGRGADLNTTVAALPALFARLRSVAANLADPRTRLARFFDKVGAAARAVGPVGEIQGRLFTDLARTFSAISRDPVALKETIARSPGTLDAGTDSLHAQLPFLRDTADFSHDLRGAVHELRGALPELNPALEVGGPVLRRSVALNERLQDTLRALRSLTTSPGTGIAVRGLLATVTTLQPQLRFLGPYQTVCDYWNYWWTYVAEHFSETDPTGQAQRVILATNGVQTNGLGTQGAYQPANGEGYVAATAPLGAREVLHNQNYVAAVDSRGRADCEGGQHGYSAGPLATFGPKNDLQGNPFRLVVDPHTPGLVGPTFKGRQRVPPGETFTTEPGGISPQLEPALREP